MISEAVALDSKEKSSSSKLSRKSAEIEGTFEIRINSNADKNFSINSYISTNIGKILSLSS